MGTFRELLRAGTQKALGSLVTQCEHSSWPWVQVALIFCLRTQIIPLTPRPILLHPHPHPSSPPSWSGHPPLTSNDLLGESLGAPAWHSWMRGSDTLGFQKNTVQAHIWFPASLVNGVPNVCTHQHYTTTHEGESNAGTCSTVGKNCPTFNWVKRGRFKVTHHRTEGQEAQQ